MREILVRGKRDKRFSDRGEWIYGIPQKFEGKYTHIYNSDGHFCIIPETLGEYTNLTDKNGTKIFEGDILKIKYTPKSIVAVVKYDEFCAGFVAVVSEYLTLGFGADFDNNSCEIIGNVYDDPELLSTASLPETEDISQPILQPATPENFELMPI